MAAVRPLVLVYQDFANQSVVATNPDLNVLIVGPAYHIQDYVDVSATPAYAYTVGSATETPSGTPLDGTTGKELAATALPQFPAGASLDTSSYAATFKTAHVELMARQDLDLTENSNLVTTSAGNFLTSGVAAGDRIVIRIATAPTPVVVAKTVKEVVDATNLRLTTNITAAGTTITGTSYTGATILTDASALFRVERVLSNVAPVTAVTLNTAVSPPTAAYADLQVSVGGQNKYVVYGTLFPAYRALKKTHAVNTDVQEIFKTSDITSLIGEIDERNPLAVGAHVALQNSVKKVQVLGVTGDNLNGATDLLTAHTAAKDKIRGRRDVYAIVPLSFDTTVIGMWRNDVVALSAPEISKFRVVIGGGNITATKTVTSGTGTSSTGTGLLRDNSGTFITSGVIANDTVSFESATYTVSAVVSENELTVTPVIPSTATGAYSVTRAHTRDSWVTDLNATATSLKHKRCVMVWPNECYVSGVQNELTQVQSRHAGYFLACAIGGMVAGLPPHQGFTFIGLAGISQIFNSNTYLYDSHVDALSSGGWYVVVQDAPTALPYSVHALTTDTTTLETGELMIVKNFDYVSLTYRDAFVGFLGIYNITTETLDLLRSAFDSVTDQLRIRHFPKIGAPLKSATITSLSVLAGSQDQVELYAEVELPRPLNRIGLHLTG